MCGPVGQHGFAPTEGIYVAAKRGATRFRKYQSIARVAVPKDQISFAKITAVTRSRSPTRIFRIPYKMKWYKASERAVSRRKKRAGYKFVVISEGILK